MDVTFRWREGIDRPDWLQKACWQSVADLILDCEYCINVGQGGEG